MKQGIAFDYDLMANAESAARAQTCGACGMSPVTYRWSDYSGEGMCVQCGTPYQLKWGGEEREKEGAYPYLNLREDALPLVREYYRETGRFTYLGTGFNRPGLREFNQWVERRHPEFVAARKAEREAKETTEISVLPEHSTEK